MLRTFLRAPALLRILSPSRTRILLLLNLLINLWSLKPSQTMKQMHAVPGRELDALGSNSLPCWCRLNLCVPNFKAVRGME
ncbi:hypothetical protein IWW34DRAFT_735436 [Fusarium oxysporum f. sp. albedinis]|nr:hypothetical protein IWW34DRAFT_735436 [Fusarium oxysporum f. sp. albedinis]